MKSVRTARPAQVRTHVRLQLSYAGTSVRRLWRRARARAGQCKGVSRSRAAACAAQQSSLTPAQHQALLITPAFAHLVRVSALAHACPLPGDGAEKHTESH